MLIKKFENDYVIRLEKGEELVKALSEFAKKYDVKLASVTGLGAANLITVGLFNTESKVYMSREFSGDFEIVSLTGNISTMANETYLHLHASFADKNLVVHGGHLNSAYISATAEIIVKKINGEVDRFYDEDSGLNLIK